MHPFFWLVTLLLGASGDADPKSVLMWVGVVFVSILVHELGHAAAHIMFGGRPWITLYGMGGLASCERRPPSMLGNIWISLAGPLAGFLLAGVVLLGIKLSGRAVVFVPRLIPVVYGPGFANTNLDLLVWFFLYVNILWGLINLLPVYPLDGGQISRELLLGVSARNGISWSLGLSMTVAAGLAVYAISKKDFYVALMFGYLAYSSMAAMQAYQRWDRP